MLLKPGSPHHLSALPRAALDLVPPALVQPPRDVLQQPEVRDHVHVFHVAQGLELGLVPLAVAGGGGLVVPDTLEAAGADLALGAAVLRGPGTERAGLLLIAAIGRRQAHGDDQTSDTLEKRIL